MFEIKEKKQVTYPTISDELLIYPTDRTESEIKSTLGRKWQSILKSHKCLIKFIDRNRSDKNIVCISQTSKFLIKKFKCQECVFRAIQRMKDIDLIQKIDNVQSKKGEYGLFYAVNENNLELVNKIINKFIIDKKVIDKQSYNSIADSQEVECTNYKDTNLDFRKIKVSDAPRNISDDAVFVLLNKKYPQLADYQQQVTNLNHFETEDDYLIEFTPTITRNDENRVTNIGIRATTSFCNKKSREKAEKRGEFIPSYIKCREDYLDDDLGALWQEYDVKGSVPRISHLMLTGEWLAPEIDPYKVMFESLVDEWNYENRQQMKLWFMRLYFGGSVAQIVRNAIFDDSVQVTEAEKDQLTAWITKAKQAVIDFCGEPTNTAVFLHESCIYLDVRIELLKRHIKTIQVYDGFYFPCGTMPLDMPQIIKNAALNYFNKYGGTPYVHD